MFRRLIFFLTAFILSLSAVGLFANNELDVSGYISSSSRTRKNSKEQQRKDPMPFKICQPMNPAFYLGFGGFVGEQLSQELTSTSFVERANQLDVQTHTIRQNLPYIGFLGIAGYQLNSILSFEVYYSQSAWDYRLTDRFVYQVDRINEAHEQITKREVLDFGPRVLIALPFHKYFSPYFLGGLFVQYFDQTSNFSNALNFPTLNEETSKMWQLRFAQGFGIRSQLTKNFGLRLEVYVPAFLDQGTRTNLITFVSF